MNFYKEEDEQVVKFLKHLNNMIDYWSKQEDTSDREKVQGVVFSFLVLIDEKLEVIDRETGKELSIGYLHEIVNDYINVTNKP